MKDRSPSRAATIWWHDVRLLRILSQALFLLIIIAVAGFLYANIRTNMARRGLSLGYDFLTVDSGFFIGEGIPFHLKDPYWYAFLVGVVNTLRVALVGIVLATVLGLFMGIARLSGNWLVNKIASAYVEIFRNTPLLVQLFFWYSAVFLMLPRVRESVALPGGDLCQQRRGGPAVVYAHGRSELLGHLARSRNALGSDHLPPPPPSTAAGRPTWVPYFVGSSSLCRDSDRGVVPQPSSATTGRYSGLRTL